MALNLGAVGQIPAAYGEVDGGAVGEFAGDVDAALAEGGGAGDGGAPVGFDGAGEDFAGAGGVFVDQRYHRNVFGGAAAAGFVVVAVVLGVNFVKDGAAVQEQAGDIHDRLQQAAGVVAEIQDEAPAAGVPELPDGVAGFGLGGVGEAVNPEVSDAIVQHTEGHAFNGDAPAGYGDGHAFGVAVVPDEQGDVGAAGAADAVDGVNEGEFGHAFAVHGEDDVAGEDAGGFGGGAGDGGDDGEAGVGDGHLGADALKVAAKFLLVAVVLFGAQIGGVGVVQGGEDAADGAVGQLIRRQLSAVDVLGQEDAVGFGDLAQFRGQAFAAGGDGLADAGADAGAGQSGASHYGQQDEQDGEGTEAAPGQAEAPPVEWRVAVNHRQAL